MVPTATRVQENTSDEINQCIKKQTERNIVFYAANPNQIQGRLKELRTEWDIERAIEANADVKIKLSGSSPECGSGRPLV